MTENHTPPRGQKKLRSSRPLPVLCISLTTTVPSSAPAAAAFLASSLVDLTSSKLMTDCPRSFVGRLWVISSGSSLSGVPVRQ